MRTERQGNGDTQCALSGAVYGQAQAELHGDPIVIDDEVLQRF